MSWDLWLSPDVELILKPEVDEAEVAAIQAEIGVLLQAFRDMREQAEKNTYTVIRSFRQIPIMMRTIGSVMGVVNDAVTSSIVNLIETVMYSVLTMHRMKELASGGLMATLTLGMSWAAIVAASAAVAAAWMGHAENKKALDSMTRGIESIEVTLWQLRWTYKGR